MQIIYITIIEKKYNGFTLQNKIPVNVSETMSFDEAILELKKQVSNETFVPIKYLKHKLYVRDNSQYYELFPNDESITEYTLGEML